MVTVIAESRWYPIGCKAARKRGNPPIRDSAKIAGRTSRARSSKNPLPLECGSTSTVVTPINMAMMGTARGNNSTAFCPIGEKAIVEREMEKASPTYFLYCEKET